MKYGFFRGMLAITCVLIFFVSCNSRCNTIDENATDKNPETSNEKIDSDNSQCNSIDESAADKNTETDNDKIVPEFIVDLNYEPRVFTEEENKIIEEIKDMPAILYRFQYTIALTPCNKSSDYMCSIFAFYIPKNMYVESPYEIGPIYLKNVYEVAQVVNMIGFFPAVWNSYNDGEEAIDKERYHIGKAELYKIEKILKDKYGMEAPEKWTIYE